jgi:hypothetical protein
MQDAELFEKQTEPDFSKSCGRRRSLSHTALLSAENKPGSTPRHKHFAECL